MTVESPGTGTEPVVMGPAGEPGVETVTGELPLGVEPAGVDSPAAGDVPAGLDAVTGELPLGLAGLVWPGMRPPGAVSVEPAGPVSTGVEPAGTVPAGTVPAGTVLAGTVPAGVDSPAAGEVSAGLDAVTGELPLGPAGPVWPGVRPPGAVSMGVDPAGVDSPAAGKVPVSVTGQTVVERAMVEVITVVE